ncbi:hypothetical protein G3H63_16270 [Microbacterium resistens]|uniref:YCII-related domain-containing protein n=1 Tax=Microbacterium resistens TaxID=156977 RepID=A0ABY3RW86_9MICO|nr:hypothetical protein [Microbacterium resistens]MBW1640619.1 hypothetical protein [Microbacterium resistens]UGS27245.1 hypothetical protein K8F61_03275 [Microbacterium resistens]
MNESTTTHVWVVRSEAGADRDLRIPMRQQPWWDDHAAFINALVDEGDVLLGGAFPDEGGAVLVMRAPDEETIRRRLANDPWYVHRILRLAQVSRWDVLIDEWPRN